MYIYQTDRWPNFTWNKDLINNLLKDIKYQQGLLMGRMSSLRNDLSMEANLEILTQDIVKSSAIEGKILDDQEVRSSISQKLGLPLAITTPYNREIEGIVSILMDATSNFKDDITKDRLFAWHSALFPSGYSELRKITIGNWRQDITGPMQVVSGPTGNEKVHFQAPGGEDVDVEMSQFFNWCNLKTDLDDIIKSAIAHFWFVTIHPFEDGNGRIARALSELFLARSDQSTKRFYSISTMIEKDRKEYYFILESCQRGSIDITSWLLWFLECLGKAFNNTDHIIKKVLTKANFWKNANNYSLNSRQILCINRLLDNFIGPMTSTKYAKISKCSGDAALRDLQDLIAKGLLRLGDKGGRSTHYLINEISKEQNS